MDAVPWLLRCVASSSAVRRRTIPASTLASEALVGATSGGIWAVRVARSRFTCSTSKGAIALTPFHGDIRKEAPKGKLSMRDAERKQRDRTGGCGQEDCTAVDRPVKLLPRPRGNESRQFLTVGERDDAGVIGVRQVRGRIQIRDCFVRGWLAGERRGHSCSWNVEDSVFRAHSRARAASQNTPCDWRGGRIRGGGIRERIGTSH